MNIFTQLFGKKYDFVAIGDIVVEPFIKLEVGEIKDGPHGKELDLPYGTKIPYESETFVAGVGNSANAAVSASRLGLKTALVSFIGDDNNGILCLDVLKKEKVSTDFIVTEKGKLTNHHFVLWEGDDRTILVKHEDFSYTLPSIGEPAWVYLSSLSEKSKDFHHEIATYLMGRPAIKLAFQPGTFQMKLGLEELKDIYSRTNVLCVNKEEAQSILQTEAVDIKILLTEMSKLINGIMIITDGPHGSYMMENSIAYQVPIYPDIAPAIERTGAGDAFFSTFVAYLAKGLTAQEALKRAPINSMSVVEKIGAQEGLLSHEKIEELLLQAPATYTITTL